MNLFMLHLQTAYLEKFPKEHHPSFSNFSEALTRALDRLCEEYCTEHDDEEDEFLYDIDYPCDLPTEELIKKLRKCWELSNAEQLTLMMTPTTTPELAFEIQDLAIVRDEDGEETWIDAQSIPIETVLPYAIVLVEAIKDYPDQTIATLRRQLIRWIAGLQQKNRAYNIKSLTFQICEKLTDPRPSKPVNDEIPF